DWLRRWPRFGNFHFMDSDLMPPLAAQAYEIIEQLVSRASRAYGVQVNVNFCIESLQICAGIDEALTVNTSIICFDWHWHWRMCELEFYFMM
ncbi:hypothetical protein, partial [Xanthomonas campestris]|uniref:hypothetical protein n=1 Tax=Xanthomonas campestris TaxID=339 RepID=UPI002269EC78